MARPNCHIGNKRCQGTRLSEQTILFFCTKAEGEALRNIVSKLSEERNFWDLHLKHYHMSAAQSRRERLSWIFPDNFMTSINTW